MRFCSLVVCAMLAGQANAYSENYVRNNVELLWKSFKDSYNRKYVSVQEETARFRIFKQNMIEAARLEAMQVSGATFGIGPFSDLSADEFKVYHSLEGRDIPSPANMYTDDEVKAAADHKDWRDDGAVTHVKNQAQCGSCWAFSATGSIEGAWKLAGNQLTAVSEQELVSCDKTDDGCNGGLPEDAFKWLINKRRGQIVTEESYPYKSGAGIRHQCSPDLDSFTVGATIRNHQRLPHNEDQMKTWISTNGPASIGVDAGRFQSYRGGIMSNCCVGRCRLDHGVLIVGYDTSGSDPYWIIKNSWGPSWGENGYIRVRYGHGECGLDQDPTAPSA